PHGQGYTKHPFMIISQKIRYLLISRYLRYLCLNLQRNSPLHPQNQELLCAKEEISDVQNKTMY
ncbi:unnamed protein product, partial [Allacma fusca]